jgi:hypothetical protein
LRKATPQKKTLRRSKKSPSVLLRTVCAKAHRTVRWHNGLAGAHKPDCPVHQGTPAQRLVPDGTQREDHQTVRCEHQTVRCGKAYGPTVTCSDRATLGAPDMLQCAVRCTTRLSGVPQRTAAFSPTAILELGPIYTSPNRPFEGVGAQATYQGI